MAVEPAVERKRARQDQHESHDRVGLSGEIDVHDPLQDRNDQIHHQVWNDLPFDLVEKRQIWIAADGGDHVHAREVIDVVGQRRPGIEQDRDRRDGGQSHEQRGDLPGAETDGLLWDRLSFAGENAEPAWRWCRWAPPLCCAQPEKLTDINHFGLRRSGAASPKRWGERKSVLVDTSPGGECSIDSTYHVDMPKSTIASRGGIGLRAQWVEPREGFRRVRGCTRKSIGSTRSQAWRPSASHALARSESGHHLRDVISSAIRPNCARRQTRRVQDAREKCQWEAAC